MSVRSFKRAHARRLERERRRLQTLGRRGLVAGATLGASAVFASSAQATNTLTVTTNGDDAPGGTCPSGQCTTLRDALSVANADTTSDTITFASGVTGTITLSNGALPISGSHAITIQGPGQGVLAVSGNNASQVFHITAPASAGPETISGLTIENGNSGTTSGGAIEVPYPNTGNPGVALALSGDTIKDSTTSANNGGGGIYAGGPLTLTQSTVSGNHATGSPGRGGGIELASPPGLFFTSTPANEVSITASTISGNTATSSGGGIGAIGNGGPFAYDYGGNVTISGGSQVTGNSAAGTTYAYGGGIDASRFRSFKLDHSTVSGNSAVESAGIATSAKYGSQVTGSTIANNIATKGAGGMGAFDLPFGKYSPLLIDNSTISGNQGADGAGLAFYNIGVGSPATIRSSTISGNRGGTNSFGGGIDVAKYVQAPFRLEDSTISGNTATHGGGISLGDDNQNQVINKYNYQNHSYQGNGSISFDNSTIASNNASTGGGGIYLAHYTKPHNSASQSAEATIAGTDVSGNIAHGTAEDLERASGSTTGGFNGAFSLVQTPGSAPILTKQNLITGVNPQLGPLANNGGPTETMLPSGTSPLIDQGFRFDNVNTDQRGDQRTVDTPVPNPPGGDGTDIGSVELPASAVSGGFGVTINGKLLGGTKTPLIAGGASPVQCTVRIGPISACVVKVKVGNKVVASGSGYNTKPTFRISLRIAPTATGKRFFKHHPLGAGAVATAVGVAPGNPTLSGKVHVLAGPSFKLRMRGRSTSLSKHVRSELAEIATLLTGEAKRVRCTAYTSKGTGDAALTKTQARKACRTLRKDGLKVHRKAVGAGSAAPSKPFLVISFKL